MYRAAKRIQQATRRFLLNNRLRLDILAFHELCKKAYALPEGVDVVKESITLHAHYYRNKWQRYCTMYHSAAIGGQIELLELVDLCPYDLLEPDIDGNRLLHWLATNPNLTLVKFLCEILFQIKTTLAIQLVDDDDDGEEEEALSPGQEAAASALVSHDLMTKLPILHSGWMKKSSSILGIKTFKRRYCVLTEESFVLYHSVNKRPAGYINIEGCIIERLNNAEPIIAIRRPDLNPNAKKSMFSSEGAHQSYTMKVDNETIAQEWLTALKLAAGVRPFRSSPVKYLNMNVRTQWVRILSKFGRTALHELARLKDDNSSATYSYDLIQMAAWLVEYGCNILQKDKYGKTAYDYAKLSGNQALIAFFTARQASIDNNSPSKSGKKNRITMSVLDKQALDDSDTTTNTKANTTTKDRKHVLSSLKLKGFSYLQMHFGRFKFLNDK